MRLAVQLRFSGTPDVQRWQRSVYLDETSRELTVFFDEMTPVGETTTGEPPLHQVQALLFVIDTLNTLPSNRGASCGCKTFGLKLTKPLVPTRPTVPARLTHPTCPTRLSDLGWHSQEKVDGCGAKQDVRRPCRKHRLPFRPALPIGVKDD